MEHQVTISLLRQQIHALDELTRLIDKAGTSGPRVTAQDARPGTGRDAQRRA